MMNFMQSTVSVKEDNTMKQILAKCTQSDFEYLSEVLDSYVSFTDDSKRKDLLAQYPYSKSELVDLMDKQIRYYGSSDVAYLWRSLFNNDGGVSAQEIISDVASKLKVSLKLGVSVERSLEILATKLVEKELQKKKPEELKELFKSVGVGNANLEQIADFMKHNGKAAVLPLLMKLCGPQFVYSLVQSIIVGVLAVYLGKEAAKKLLSELLKRNPWLAAFGPVVWFVSAGWVAADLQGAAYRKTVPICLYLGLVALRDGEEKE